MAGFSRPWRNTCEGLSRSLARGFSSPWLNNSVGISRFFLSIAPIFLIIFYVYDSKIHFIYAILFIFRFLFLIVTSSHPVTASLFFSQNNGVISPSTLLGFFVFWGVSSLPMSGTTHSDRCLHTNYFAERSCCRHIPPLRSLLLDSSSAVATTLSMATDLAATPHLYPLFLTLAAYPSKHFQDHYTTAPH